MDGDGMARAKEPPEVITNIVEVDALVLVEEELKAGRSRRAIGFDRTPGRDRFAGVRLGTGDVRRGMVGRQRTQYTGISRSDKRATRR